MGSSGGGSAPSGRGPGAPRAWRGRRARRRRPCACAACGSPSRAPPALLLEVLFEGRFLVVVVLVERLARELLAARVEQDDLERVAAVRVGRQQREALFG